MTFTDITREWAQSALGSPSFTCGRCGWVAGPLIYQAPITAPCKRCKGVWAPQTTSNLGVGLILVGAATGSRGVIVCERRPRRPKR